jgi:glutamine amidotransferase
VIAVLDYGMGNLRSVCRALERVGGKPELVSDPGSAAKADALVVPGVGAFGACMRGLRDRGLDAAIAQFVASDRPLLGVCLGLQVLFDASDEDDDPGLGVLSGRVRRLPSTVKVPHMGWSEVEWVSDHPLIRDVPTGTRFYFVHSFAPDPDPAFTVGQTEYGRAFASVVSRGSLFATQFHPEKSGDPGLALYQSFVKEVQA